MPRFGKIAAPLMLLVLLCPAGLGAVETAPRISDREIVERLTRLEAGQGHLASTIEANAAATDQLRTEMQGQLQQLRAEMQGQLQQLRAEMQGQLQQLRAEMQGQIEQLRTDMNAQFGRLAQLMLGVVGAFAAIVAATLGFALWDRRTMVRPFESRVQAVEEELTRNREHLHSLLEALRSLGHQDEKVAAVLRQFHLL